MNCLNRIFNCEKPLIAMMHFPALPGRCGYDLSRGMKGIIDSIKFDLEALQNGRVDALLFCNEGDLPYMFKVGPSEIAAAAAVVGELKKEISVPFGVNLLWDPVASLAVANATGAKFVREVFTGAYESDMGVFSTNCGEAFDFRRNIGGQEIAIFDNISPEFSKTLAERDIAERAKSAEYMGVDALLISGAAAGRELDFEDLIKVKNAVKHIPVLANTGVCFENAKRIFEIADGAIIGTGLKVDGCTWNRVDPERVKKMVELVKRCRD